MTCSTKSAKGLIIPGKAVGWKEKNAYGFKWPVISEPSTNPHIFTPTSFTSHRGTLLRLNPFCSLDKSIERGTPTTLIVNIAWLFMSPLSLISPCETGGK